MLISACYPAGLSRYNPIEHLWSPCSKYLAGVQLSPCFPDETTPPALQNIPDEEKNEKEKVVFSHALDKVDQYWDGKVHDGFRITSQGIKPTVPGDGGENSPSESDYNAVQNMFSSSLRSLNENEEAAKLLDEWKYYIQHMDRRRGFVCFRKGSCGDAECDCMDSERELVAKEVGKVPMGEKWLFPPITPDQNHPDHYQTFHQLQNALSFSMPDQHLKDGIKTQCTKCRYVVLKSNGVFLHHALIMFSFLAEVRF